MSQMKGIVDFLLTDASSAYIPDGCIADKLLPNLKFAQYTGKLGEYGSNHLRIENTVVGGKGKYRQVESIVRQTSSFEIEGHGLTGIVSERDYKNVIDPFDAEKDETIGVSTILMLEKEKGLADSLSDTGVLTQNVTLSGTDQFNDYVNSDPVQVVIEAKNAIRNGSGAIANTLIVEYQVAEYLRHHPAILDKLGYKYNRNGGLSDQELARAFNVAKVFIPNAMYNSAAEGQTPALTPVWGKHMILAAIPDSAAKYQLSLGYNIRLAGNEAPRKVFKQPLFNPPGSTEILVEDKYDLVLSNVKCGYLIKDAIA